MVNVSLYLLDCGMVSISYLKVTLSQCQGWAWQWAQAGHPSHSHHCLSFLPNTYAVCCDDQLTEVQVYLDFCQIEYEDYLRSHLENAMQESPVLAKNLETFLSDQGTYRYESRIVIFSCFWHKRMPVTFSLASHPRIASC